MPVLRPLIVFRELKTPFRPGYCNLSASSAGTRITASSTFVDGGHPFYQVSHINDGLYGDHHAWIASESDSSPWLKIALPSTSKIDMIVFGRDNWSAGLYNNNQHVVPNRSGFDDRNIRELAIRVSLDGQNWSNPVYRKPQFPDLKAGDDWIVKLDKPATCRFVRFEFQPNSACIDELEVYGTSEASVDSNDL